jgi:hypothetical protein
MKPIHGALVAFLVGCNGQTLHVGDDGSAGGAASTQPDNSAGGSSTGGSSTGGSSNTEPWPSVTPICSTPTFDVADGNWPDPATCAAAASGTQSDIVGIWEGRSEDEYFNPIAKYRLTILAASSGGLLCGTLKYGEGDPPPLSSDPTAWYPPLDSPYYDSVRNEGSMFSAPGTQGMLDGFTYTILKGGQLDNQLAFSVSSFEHFQAWCGLQNAYPTGLAADSPPYGAYHCLPRGGETVTPADRSQPCAIVHGTQTVTITAAQCTLCGLESPPIGICTCDSCHCTASMTDTDKISLTFFGDSATGKIEHNLYGEVDNNPRTLRLSRVQP